MTDEDYYRCLDSLVRFYNSEIVVHVGYLLTAALTLLASFSLLLTSGILADLIMRLFVFFGATLESKDAAWVGFGLCVVAGAIWLLRRFRFSFSYLYGRTLYYECLSQITWDHMGMQQWSTPSRNLRLRHRALGTKKEKRLGVIAAVTKLFEAYLYISKCKREGVDVGTIHQNLKEFRVDEDICPIETETYYSNEKRFRWNQTDLLLLAYRSKIREYVRNHEKIGSLLNTDCWSGRLVKEKSVFRSP